MKSLIILFEYNFFVPQKMLQPTPTPLKLIVFAFLFFVFQSFERLTWHKRHMWKVPSRFYIYTILHEQHSVDYMHTTRLTKLEILEHLTVSNKRQFVY